MDHKEFLFKLLDVLEQNNIPYFLFCGTLLGAVRENNFLKSDIYDTDICVDDSDYWKVRYIFNKFISENPGFYYKAIWRKEIAVGHQPSQLKLDIFFMEKKEDKYLIYSYKPNPDNGRWNLEWRARFNYNLFYPLSKIEFLGRYVSVPKDYIQALVEHYGRNWKTPDSHHKVGQDEDVDVKYRGFYPAGIPGNLYPLPTKECNIGYMLVNFIRKEETKRCIESIAANVPNMKIYVADQDAPCGEMIEFYERYNVEYYYMPHDCGLSVCRNFLIDKIREPYLMWGDNDFIFGNNHNIGKALALLENKPEIGFVGGSVWVNGEMMHYERLLSYLSKYGILIYVPLELTNPPKQIFKDIEYYYCDLTFNYVLARTKHMMDNPKLRWNPDIKVRYEHSNFFMHLLQYQDLRVAYCPAMVVIHAHSTRNDEYNKYRGRKNDGKAFADEFQLGMNFTVGSGREVYSTGEILTAAQLHDLKKTLTERNWWTT